MKSLGTGAFKPRDREPLAPWTVPTDRPLRIALITPRFHPTFYGSDFAIEVFGGRAAAAQLSVGMPLLAALTPEPHEVTLFDEAVDELDFEALREFDIIGLTGMIIQQERMKEILASLETYPGLLIVGGPFMSVDEDTFTGLCDAAFVGEADQTWPAFLEKLVETGSWETRYEQTERTDVVTLPPLRFDLVDLSRYRSVGIQFSRGCPFLCEFCDIITIFGRKPRARRPEQVIAELEMLVSRGVTHVTIIDDNFIGNKKLARELLVSLVEWQKENGYPLALSTEASINLADEPDLLSLMAEAAFKYVFIGIESPSEDSLAEIRKVQNTRGDSIPDKIRRIQAAGIYVDAGFIAGFDNDGPDIFPTQGEFIESLAIARAAVMALIAIPSTPLHDRLKSEGRLVSDNGNCNFRPAQMTADELVRGVDELNLQLFQPEAYFDRYLRCTAQSDVLRTRAEEHRQRQKRAPIAARLLRGALSLRLAARFSYFLVRHGEFANLVPRYLRIYRDRARYAGAGSMPVAEFVAACVGHWHLYRLFSLRKQGVITAVGYGAEKTEREPARRPAAPRPVEVAALQAAGAR